MNMPSLQEWNKISRIYETASAYTARFLNKLVLEGAIWCDSTSNTFTIDFLSCATTIEPGKADYRLVRVIYANISGMERYNHGDSL